MSEDDKNKIDWSIFDKETIEKIITETVVEYHREKEKKWKEYWRYHLFTPLHIRLWHKITFKKTPKL